MSDWNSEVAEWYAEHYGEYPTNRLAVDRLDLADNMTIVDVGCGTGSALRHAAGRVTTGRLIGIDPVPRMVEIAREQTASHPAAARITFQAGAAEELPLEAATADYVLAFDSFDHWQDKAQGLAEIRRILRADGEFVMVKDGGAPSSAEPDGAESGATVVAALVAAGFTVKEVEQVEEGDVAFTLWRCGMAA